MKKQYKQKITHCEQCGKELKYKTKRPKWCKDCNPYKDAIFYKGHSLPTRSVLEFNIQNWLNEIIDIPFIAGGFYSWIPSPKGFPLQLDFLIYGDSINPFAIEVDGVQHYNQQYFQTQEELDYLQECDRIKEVVLKQEGIILVRITQCDSKTDFIKILKEHGINYVKD